MKLSHITVCSSELFMMRKIEINLMIYFIKIFGFIPFYHIQRTCPPVEN